MVKLTVNDVKEIVEYDGLGYSIQNGISHDNIADETLASLWREARAIMEDIALYLESSR